MANKKRNKKKKNAKLSVKKKLMLQMREFGVDIGITLSSAFFALLWCSRQTPLFMACIVALTALTTGFFVFKLKVHRTNSLFSGKIAVPVTSVLAVYTSIRSAIIFADTSVTQNSVIFALSSHADSYRLFPHSEYLYAVLALPFLYFLFRYIVFFAGNFGKKLFFIIINSVKSFFRSFTHVSFTLRCVITVILCVMIGFAALTAAYTVPGEKIYQGYLRSKEIFAQGELYKEIIRDTVASAPETYVEAIMLTEAVYDSDESAMEKAAKNVCFYKEADNYDDYIDSIRNYTPGDFSGYQLKSYGRYWHGYLVLLRTMLSIFTIEQMRLLHAVLQALLLAGIILLMVRKGLKKYILAFAAVLLSVCFFISPLSMQYTWIGYVTLIACLLAMLLNNKLKKAENRFIFFLIVGAATSYCDLLTYPLFAVGMPLLLLTLSDGEQARGKIYTQQTLLPTFGFFMTGYLTMWAGKWIVNAIVTGTNPLGDVGSAILKRIAYAEEDATTYAYGKFTFFDVLYNNLTDYLFNPMIIPAVVLLCCMILTVKKRHTLSEEIILPFATIAVLPLIWYFVLNNHSYIHSRYTFRILGVSVFSILCMLQTAISIPNKRANKNFHEI